MAKKAPPTKKAPTKKKVPTKKTTKKTIRLTKMRIATDLWVTMVVIQRLMWSLLLFQLAVESKKVAYVMDASDEDKSDEVSD